MFFNNIFYPIFYLLPDIFTVVKDDTELLSEQIQDN